MLCQSSDHWLKHCCVNTIFAREIFHETQTFSKDHWICNLLTFKMVASNNWTSMFFFSFLYQFRIFYHHIKTSNTHRLDCFYYLIHSTVQCEKKQPTWSSLPLNDKCFFSFMYRNHSCVRLSTLNTGNDINERGSSQELLSNRSSKYSVIMYDVSDEKDDE